MEVILHVAGNNYAKLKEKLLADEIVNRASIVFKDAKQFDKEGGYLCIVTGTEERCKRALELTKDEEGKELATEISGEEKEEILKKIKEEEDKAIEGFGGIFG
jgi:enoyl-[acyl-carrier-protein] reductase (NADH)